MAEEIFPKDTDEKLEQLKTMFCQVLDYLGDDELISSMNSEYSFDSKDVITTDGLINFSVEKVQNHNNGEIKEILSYQTCVRGGSYIIIADRPDDKTWRYGLRVDRPFISEKFDEIVARLNQMKKSIEDMEYYIDDWVEHSGGLIEDGTDIDDIY